ncbi:MAG: HEAT repeat domain-containing protein [Myxococcota bacterium]
MRAALPAAVVLAFALLAACAEGAPPAEEAPAARPLPPGEALPPAVDAMLYGSGQSCRRDAECAGRVCYFGSCMGLLLVDQRWMQERIGAALVEAAEGRPELRERLVEHLVRVLRREDTDLGYRARALVGLEGLGALEPIRKLLQRAEDERLEAAAALALVRQGEAAGLPMVRALTEHEEPAIAVEALRALGRSGHDEALEPLLRTLSPALDGMLLRAAIDGLRTLGDPRAIRPLVDFLEDAPGYLRHRTVSALRDLSGAGLGLDEASWRAWIEEHDPPRPPQVVLREWSPEGELGLPTP